MRTGLVFSCLLLVAWVSIGAPSPTGRDADRRGNSGSEAEASKAGFTKKSTEKESDSAESDDKESTEDCSAEDSSKSKGKKSSSKEEDCSQGKSTEDSSKESSGKGSGSKSKESSGKGSSGSKSKESSGKDSSSSKSKESSGKDSSSSKSKESSGKDSSGSESKESSETESSEEECADGECPAEDCVPDCGDMRRLRKRIQSLEIKLNALDADLESQQSTNDEQDKNIDELMEDKNRVVAFSAHLSEATRLDPGETLLFDAVATNLGDAYNAPTGAFTAPVDGVYQLNVHFITSSQSLLSTNLDIMVNGARRCIGYGDGAHRHTTGVCSALYELRAGDTAHVEAEDPHGDGSAVYGGLYTMFSGHLVKTL